jgi:ABC-2 type transport system permease protein
MRHVTSVAGRELRGLFVSPVAYAVLALFAILAGVFFTLTTVAFNDGILRLQQFQAFDQLSQINLNDHLIGPFYDSMAFMLMLLIPAVTMGFLASEKTNGTQELLLTSPLTMWDIVLGKFAAGAAFVLLLGVVVAAYPGLLFLYADQTAGGPEVGKTLAGLIGVLLVGWTYVAIGIFASSITRSQVVAFLLTLVLLVILIILPFVADMGVAGASGGRELLRYLSTDEHLSELRKGLVDTKDLAYFAVMISSFLVMTKAAVESVRWR